MAHALHFPPLFITQSLRDKAGELRSDLDTPILRLVTADEDGFTDITLGVAKGDISKEAVTQFFRDADAEIDFGDGTAAPAAAAEPGLTLRAAGAGERSGATPTRTRLSCSSTSVSTTAGRSFACDMPSNSS